MPVSDSSVGVYVVSTAHFKWPEGLVGNLGEPLALSGDDEERDNDEGDFAVEQRTSFDIAEV